MLFAINIEPLASLIRQNKNIKGIKDGGGIEHKISLYADDVLTYISDPISSVPALIKNLEEYGKLSGYQINQSKSEAMMLMGHWPTQLAGKFEFHWSNHGFRYLGIIITPDTSQLFKANYGKLTGEIKTDLTRWEVLPLSLTGRVETIRMTILPRLLFMFQSLPVEVPTSTFKTINKWISTFMWQNKIPRVKFKRLQTSKDKGGLTLPNLRKYYEAAQLRSMVAWISWDIDIIWVGIEQNDCRAGHDSVYEQKYMEGK